VQKAKTLWREGIMFHRPGILVVAALVSLCLLSAAGSQQIQQSNKHDKSLQPVNLSRNYAPLPCVDGEMIRADRLRRNAEVDAQSDFADPQHIVTVWIGGQSINTSVSFDGGKSWSISKPLLLNACLNQNLADYKGGADPRVGIGAGKTVYVSALVGHRKIDRQWLIVDTSRDGGLTWNDPVILDRLRTAKSEFDNPSIVVDAENPAAAYVAAESIDDNSTSSVAFSRTTDHGKTWSPIRPITPSIHARTLGPQLLLEHRSNRLYAFYVERETDGSWLAFVHSDDHGMTWSQPAKIVEIVPPRSEMRLGDWGTPFIAAEDMVHVASDAKRGTLYCVFADARATSGNRLTVSLISSKDLGKSWSTLISVSTPSKGHAFQPSVAVNSRGDVGVAYYDTRSEFVEQSGKTLPISIWLQVFRSGKRLREVLLDQFNYAGLGSRGLLDYQALVAVSHGFHGLYTKSNLGPGQPLSNEVSGNLTDIYFH
jgi:hypothetical protein